MTARLVVAGAVLAAAGAPLLAGDQYVLHVLIMWGIYGVLTLGLNVINGFTGQLSLGQGAFYGIGAYCAAILTVTAGWSFWAATPAATALSALVGMLISLPVLRVRGIYLGMATFGFAEIVHVVLRSWERLTKGVLGIAGILPPIALGVDFGTQDRFFYLVLAAVLLSVLLSHRIYQSFVGHALLAIRDDELAASLLGINTTAYKVAAFGVAAGLGGLAGSLFAHYLTYISPENFTSVESILIVTMLIVGGRGNTLGAVVGAGLLVALPEFLRVVNVYRLLIYGLLLVGAAVFRPDGLVGRVGRGRRRARGAAATLPDPVRTAAGPAPLLRVEDLRVRFGGLVALDAVSFSVERGEVYGIIGPNGAGKTTLFNAITGVAPVSRGRFRLGDQDLSGLAPHRRSRAGIARTFQNIRAFAGMRAWETVEVGFHARLRRGALAHLCATPGARAEAGAVRSHADALLRFVGLEDVSEQLARNLSYGHQRRLEIARALATGPQLLLLDEPAAGMNESECEELIGLIRRIRDQGVTILLVEHHMQVVMGVSDRILVLNFGRPIAEGTPAAIRDDPAVNAAYLGTEVQGAARERPSVLELRDLGVHYGRIHALRAASLRVHAGEIVAVLGSNGAGKSTMLRAISGLIRPSGGQILLDGQPVAGLAAHRVVARGVIHCPEGRQVFPRMSVRENLLLGAHRCRDRVEVAARVERAHALFPILHERAAQTAGTLSGGEQQMLAIGRALMGGPRLLLLDEPSLGLAPRIIETIFGAVTAINAAGTTILMVEQNAAKALAIAHRAYVLQVGQVVAEGRGRDLLADGQIRRAYLGH